MKIGFLKCALVLVCFGPVALGQSDWREILHDRLPTYGHRNWIVVADSAYPDQTSPGIETVVSHSDQLDVLKGVLASIGASKHVKPIVYTDKELNFVSESDAPGVTAYRDELAGLLGNRKVNTLPHAEIISKLDEAGKTFRILIIKTNMTIPYTSVFLRLDCGYCAPGLDERIRAAMASHQ